MKKEEGKSPTSEDLAKLAHHCQSIIKADPADARIAIPLLQMRNAHPSNLQAYAPLFEHNAGNEVFMNFAKTLALSASALWRREAFWFGDELPDTCDVLFISHFTNQSNKSLTADSYFGELPSKLAADGLSSVTACINHTHTTSRILQSDWQAWSQPRVVLSRTLELGEEFRILAALNSQRARLKKLSADSGEFWIKRIARLASARALAPQSTTALRVARQVEKLVRKLRPKMIVTTFEGHPWEKLAFKAARRANPGIFCVGYHHTILFPEQHALGTLMGGQFDPDAIVTAGDISAQWFSNQPALHSIPVSVLGSPRAGSSSGRVEPRDGDSVLVAPEGLLDETLTLFDTAIQAATLQPEQKFVLRLHPVIARSLVLQNRADWAELPANVAWSGEALEHDLSHSRYILYRGSTVVISAVLHGVKPFYLPLPGEAFAIDPLSDAPGWGMSVKGSEQLVQELAADRELSDENRVDGFRECYNYCQKYFTELNHQSLVELFSVANQNLE